METLLNDDNQLAVANNTYQSLDEVTSALKNNASSHGFTIIKARIKKNTRTGDIKVYYYRYNRGRKVKEPTSQRRTYTTTRLINYP